MLTETQRILTTLGLAYERGKAGAVGGTNEEMSTPGYADAWGLGDRASRGEAIDMMMVADVMAQALEAKTPPLALHAVTQCNEAHRLLDGAGIARTKRVPQRANVGAQIEVTRGLAERIKDVINKGR